MRDALFLRCGLDPPDLPNYFDGCNAKFSICHGLYCKRGGLVTARHNEIQDGVADLAGKDVTPSHVRNDPLIFSRSVVKRPKDKLAKTTGLTNWDNAPLSEATQQKGELLIRDLW